MHILFKISNRYLSKYVSCKETKVRTNHEPPLLNTGINFVTSLKVEVADSMVNKMTEKCFLTIFHRPF